MPLAPGAERDPGLAGPLGGLLVGGARARGAMLLLRAIRWWRDLARLGVHVPLFVAHDLGLLYAAPRDQLDLGPRPALEAVAGRDARLADLAAGYRALVDELARSQTATRAAAMRLGDDLVVVILARLLSSVAREVKAAPWPDRLPLDADVARDLDGQLATLWAAQPRALERATLEALARGRLRLLTMADALDLATLRLLGMLGGDAVGAGALAHVDLLAALSNPAASDVVDFSLELLPRVLETHRTRSAGTHAVHGYAGVGRKGSIDSLVPTELAWDDAELARRMLDGELLYYTREQAHDETRRLHLVLVDASASMRGEREVFARGLAIALGKKLQLAGEEVWMRFFDSRLYEVQRVRERAPLPAAWLLAFKGERGRNPARVFAQLATELALARSRDRRDTVVHLVTHGALHVPRHLVQEVRRHAHLFGVFILPSGGALDLEWTDLLSGHSVIDHATLGQRTARAAAAAKIVDVAGG